MPRIRVRQSRGDAAALKQGLTSEERRCLQDRQDVLVRIKCVHGLCKNVHAVGSWLVMGMLGFHRTGSCEGPGFSSRISGRNFEIFIISSTRPRRFNQMLGNAVCMVLLKTCVALLNKPALLAFFSPVTPLV